MNTKKIRTFLLTGAVMCFAIPVMAAPAASQTPADSTVAYVAGGIGEDELQALQDTSKNYNLKIISSDAEGHYTADTNFEITSKDGRQLINAADTGPLLYAKLPAGEYFIRATNGQQSEKRRVKLSSDKQTDVHLIWKED